MTSRERKFDAGRRSALRTGAALVAGVASAGALLRSAPARAAKAPKATMMYQDKPHGEQRCDNCIHFVAGKTPTANGTCAVVEGSISPHGWCVAYAPKA